MKARIRHHSDNYFRAFEDGTPAFDAQLDEAFMFNTRAEADAMMTAHAAFRYARVEMFHEPRLVERALQEITETLAGFQLQSEDLSEEDDREVEEIVRGLAHDIVEAWRTA